MKAACVYVVDDEEDLTWSVDRGLRRAGYGVQTASNGLQALQLMRRRRPDVVVLDIIMPDMDGFEVCRRMRADPLLSNVPIIFLTTRGEIEAKKEGFDLGGDDYMTKPFDLRELHWRIQVLLRRGRPPPPPARLQVGALSVDAEMGNAQVAGQTVSLTVVECKLLHYLLGHAGEVISSERLLQRVWGRYPGTGNPGLVRVHIQNLRLKIEPDPRQPVYIKTVPRHGYTVPLPESARGSRPPQGS